ncbi:hypothetical protein QZH41_005544 [Actinostola sp. cb2023]|nr:hypothetical protein QZH41_005544 [Actinostola sp. cb2023]
MNDHTSKGARRTREELSSASSTESEINSPKAKQCKMADEASQPTMEAVYAILMEVQRNTEKIVSDNILMHKDYEELKASLSYQSHLIEKLAKENKDLNTQVEHLTKSLTECKLELKTTATQVEALEDKDDELEMYSRKHNLEIHGVPEDNDEDLDEVVIKLATILGVEADEDDIDIVHRLPSRSKGPRPIIVKFRSHKEEKFINETNKLIDSVITNLKDENIISPQRIWELIKYEMVKELMKSNYVQEDTTTVDPEILVTLAAENNMHVGEDINKVYEENNCKAEHLDGCEPSTSGMTNYEDHSDHSNNHSPGCVKCLTSKNEMKSLKKTINNLKTKVNRTKEKLKLTRNQLLDKAVKSSKLFVDTSK